MLDSLAASDTKVKGEKTKGEQIFLKRTDASINHLCKNNRYILQHEQGSHIKYLFKK